MSKRVPQLIIRAPGSDAAFQFRDGVVIEHPAQGAGREHIALLLIYLIRRNQLGTYFGSDFPSSRLVHASRTNKYGSLPSQVPGQDAQEAEQLYKGWQSAVKRTLS